LTLFQDGAYFYISISLP